MTRLFAAELLKLRTLRSTWGFGLVALLFAGLVTAGNIGGSSEADRFDPELQFRIVLDGAFPASILALLIGIILVTNEFRHGTIARTLLATPRRGRFVTVKLLAGAAAGGVVMFVMLLVIAATAITWLGILDVPLALDEAADGVWRAFVAAVLAGVLGAAIGGAVHSQVGALVGVPLYDPCTPLGPFAGPVCGFFTFRVLRSPRNLGNEVSRPRLSPLHHSDI